MEVGKIVIQGEGVWGEEERGKVRDIHVLLVFLVRVATIII